MKKTIIAAVVCAFIAGPASAGFYINFVDQDAGNSTLISSYALATNSLVETFNNVAPLPSAPLGSAVGLDQDGVWTWGAVGTGDSGGVRQGNSSAGSPPWSHYTGQKDTTPYAVVPFDQTLGVPRQTKVEFGADYRFLGLHWGSMDTADENGWAQKILLYNDDVLVATIVAPVPADGGQSDADTNKYVNIFLTDGLVFDTAVFQSNKYAFEFDNLAVGTVPVPGAVLLGVLGLAAAGRKLRRFV